MSCAHEPEPRRAMFCPYCGWEMPCRQHAHLYALDPFYAILYGGLMPDEQSPEDTGAARGTGTS